MRDTIDHLRRLNAQFIHNYVTNDVRAHDALLHPDFTYISSNGQRLDRQTYLRNWATGFDPVAIPYWDTRDEHIIIHGAVALVSAANKYVERSQGQEQSAMAAYTDVYVLEAGEWRCLQAQITPVANAYWPPDESIVSVYRNGILQLNVRQGG